MIIFYSAFMTLMFGATVRPALKQGNDYNLVASLAAALAFWSACIFLAAVA